MKTLAIIWAACISTALLLGLQLSTCRRSGPARNPIYRIMSGTDRLPLVEISGVTQQLPAGDNLNIGSGAFASTGPSVLALERMSLTPSDSLGVFTFQTIYNDWAPTGLQTYGTLIVQGSDNSGTLITGIDSTNIAIGDVRTICNFGGHQDASSVALTNLDTRSLAANRILVPGGGDHTQSPIPTTRYKIGVDECVDVQYQNPDTTDATFKAWIVRTGHIRFERAIVQKLHLYPMISPAAISGTVNDYNPTNAGAEAYTCTTPTSDAGIGCSIDTADGTLQGTTVVNISTNDTTTRTITGLKYTDGPSGDLGPVIVLFNKGPGAVVLSNQNGGSTAADRFAFGTDITLPASGRYGLMIYHRRDDIGWLQVGHNDSLFDADVLRASVGAEFTGTDANLPLGAGWAITASETHAGASLTAGTYQQYVMHATVDNASYDTTAGAISPYGFYCNMHGTRAAGGNGVINTCGYFSVNQGDTRYAIYTDAGDVILNGGGGVLDVRSTTAYLRPNSVQIGSSLQILSGGTPAANHGTLGTGSTNWVGNVASVGAFTAVTLTYSAAFATRSWCRATMNNHSVAPEFIEVTNSASAPVFNCFNTTTGIAANCDDFTYECVGQ